MTAPTLSRTAFHRLVVVDVEPLTDDSAAITFAVPGELAEAFAFAPGQSLTIRHGDERRSYSICSPAGAAPFPAGWSVLCGQATSSRPRCRAVRSLPSCPSPRITC